MKTLVFLNDSDAAKVLEHLYLELKDGTLVISKNDELAVDLALELAGVTAIEIGAKCRLPMPDIPVDKDNPQIYVACLEAYNSGEHHGAWIDCCKDSDEIWDDIKLMLSYSPIEDAEEWEIHDDVNFPDNVELSSFSIEEISSIAGFISEHGDPFVALLESQAYNINNSFAASGNNSFAAICELVDTFETDYCGEFKSEQDFAESVWESEGKLQGLKELGIEFSYIDWEFVTKELMMNYSSVKSNGIFYIFRD